MEILRKIGKIILGFLFFISFSLLIATYSTEKITSYSSLKNIVVPILEKQINMSEEEKDMLLSWLIEKCKNQKELLLNFGENITINCNETSKINKENLQEYIANKVFDAFYFKKYDCSPLECVEKNKTFLLSSDFNKFLSSLFLPLLILNSFLMFLYILITKTWEERLLNFSFIFLFSSIPIFLLDYFYNYLFLKTSLPLEISVVTLSEIRKSLAFLYYLFLLGLLLLTIYVILITKKKFIKKKTK